MSIKLTHSKDGVWVNKWDTRYNRWNRCGRITNKGDQKEYFSTHRVVLYKHNSLGISEDILTFLSAEGVTLVVKRLGTKKDGYTYYRSTIQTYIDNGIRVKVGNEDEVMIHLPLREHVYLTGWKKDNE